MPDDSNLKINTDEHTLDADELKTLKDIAKMYQAGKIMAGFVVSLCTLGAVVLSIVPYFKGH